MVKKNRVGKSVVFGVIRHLSGSLNIYNQLEYQIIINNLDVLFEA